MGQLSVHGGCSIAMFGYRKVTHPFAHPSHWMHRIGGPTGVSDHLNHIHPSPSMSKKQTQNQRGA
jgi:hypothetical protein